MLVLTAGQGRYFNLYIKTPHGQKRLGRLKRIAGKRIAFDFDDEVVVMRDEIDEQDWCDWETRKDGAK